METQKAVVLDIPKEYYQNDPKKIINDNQVFFSTKHFELVKNKGALVHVHGATYPRKGIPKPEIIYAINILKELIKQGARHPYLILGGKNRVLGSLNAVFAKSFNPYKVHEDYLCPTARHISLIISLFLKEVGVDEQTAKETGYNLAQIAEYDDGWRYRIQDMATEADTFNLYENPRREILRLMSLWKERDREGVFLKMEKLAKPLLYLLYIPKYKKAFRKTVTYVKGMAYDEADWYWVCIKDDYKFGGIEYADRIKSIQAPPLYRIVNETVVPKEYPHAAN